MNDIVTIGLGLIALGFFGDIAIIYLQKWLDKFFAIARATRLVISAIGLLCVAYGLGVWPFG